MGAAMTPGGGPAQLGRIVRRDAREVWGHEAHEFTPWLQRHIDQPNKWGETRISSAATGVGSAPSDRGLAYQAFFAEILEALKARAPGLTTASKPQPVSWFAFSSGTPGAIFSLAFASKERFRVE